jgi:hypothetical protein
MDSKLKAANLVDIATLLHLNYTHLLKSFLEEFQIGSLKIYCSKGNYSQY